MAWDLVRHIRLLCTPKHSSSLDIAENELGAISRRSHSGRNIGGLEMEPVQIPACSAHVNSRLRGVDWRARIVGARRKLERVYPNISFWRITSVWR